MEIMEIFMEQDEKLPVFDLEDATSYMAKVVFLDEKIEEVEKVAKRYIEKINSWKESQSKELKGKKEFFEQRLIEYYSVEKDKNPKFKLSTPFGEVGQRKTAKWVYGDDGKVVRQLKALGHDELVRVKEEIDKNALKQKFKVDEGRVIDSETGEVLEEVHVVENVTYSVKVVKGLIKGAE